MKQEIQRREQKQIMWLDNTWVSIGKIDRGIVSVNAYGIYDTLEK
ncbi:hypothetical protein Sta7437_0272 [Stanieria cyanosphaera PCC 7437]|uniref:Uncharacterized protein n=1 Tax=Stanieria cyanosphaera (strain ATCC 29371 / PCC 7437) TaxID=111780 RepID=K9XQE4_STAC7|nr:hypothetical protein Sta7437_0272 [Stanieria cyanosphaera PCC 7437]